MEDLRIQLEIAFKHNNANEALVIRACGGSRIAQNVAAL